MPKYLYQGDMARLSARTEYGAVVLPKGESVEVSAEQHKVLQSHKAFKALADSGDLVVTEDTKTTRPKPEPST